MHLFLFAALLTSIAPVQTSAPNRQPQLASTPRLTALVFGSAGTIWFSASRDNGRNFSPPREVAHAPVLALGRHRGPRVSIAGKTIVVTAVTGETLASGPHAHGLPQDGNLLAWRSNDGGASWSKPSTVNDVPASAREGLHAIAVSEKGELAAVWLDLRDSGTRLYGAFSTDHAASWSPNVLLYQAPGGTICQCCEPSIVFTGKRSVAVMFRNVADGYRDMHLLAWHLGGTISLPQKLGTGTWRIDACPMDGGGLAGQSGAVYTAWRRDQTIFLDKPGQPEVPLGQGKDVALAITPKGPIAVWTGSSGLELWRHDEQKSHTLSETGVFPTLVALPDGTALAAWEDNGQIQLQAIP